MTLGQAPRQGDLLRSTVDYCVDRVRPDSIYGVLHRECFNLFPDELFADLFTDVGRRSVPPMIVSVVMVLQRVEGLSDREAVDRFSFDARWKYAAGGLGFDYPGFVHTVLVDMRARLAASARPRRIFEVTLEAAKAAGLVGRKRVLDSTPLYDAVATMDTVTLIRSAIRGLLKAAAVGLERALRGLLRRDDDYVAAGKPVCDWDDRAAREALVDALARDATALLAALDGTRLGPELSRAAALLATVVGQDLDEDADGVFRIARRVAKDRVISTVDPDARHGHKTSARGFDGYKGHVAVDPDSEIITDTVVTPGNAGDGSVAQGLIEDLLATTGDDVADTAQTAEETTAEETTRPQPGTAEEEADREPCGDGLPGTSAVYGDNAYGTGDFQEFLDDNGIDSRCKTQDPTAAGGMFTKADFDVDLEADTVTCPNGATAAIRRNRDGDGTAQFGDACTDCPLRAQCTTAKAGRTITIGRHEKHLAAARARQQDPQWKADYRATRPKVERKIGHLMRRRHGGRRARVRGRPKVAADFALLAAAVNLARFGMLGIIGEPSGNWVVATN